jgi:hypothetical protein
MDGHKAAISSPMYRVILTLRNLAEFTSQPKNLDTSSLSYISINQLQFLTSP